MGVATCLSASVGFRTRICAPFSGPDVYYAEAVAVMTTFIQISVSPTQTSSSYLTRFK